MRRIILFATLCLFFCSRISAQNALWSNDGLVSIKGGAYISIHGDASNQDSGIYDNSDTIFVTGNWTHNAPNRCFDSINTGWVYLYAADQHINGSVSTHFFNLILENQGVKYGDTDVYVDGKLSLNDRELRMDTNTVWVLNPDTAAVQRSSGYVSSWQDGGLLRRTDTTLPYLFAVGSDSGTFRYRPVTFAPLGSGINLFKVRFANVDPTTEGFDRSIKYALVCKINPLWYHRFYQLSGRDQAAITIMYDTTADGNWNDIAHWQNLPEWESIHKDTIIYSTPFDMMSKFIWSNYDSSAFALAITADSFATASNTGPYCSIDSIHLLSLPNGEASYTWTGPDSFSSNQQNPSGPAAGAGGTYTVTIANTLGCTQSASTTIVVYPSPVVTASNTGPYCSYATIELLSTPNNLPNYSWSGPNSYSSNQQNPTLPALNDSGTYTITVTDGHGCTASASTEVLVNLAPTAVAGIDTILWKGDTIQLNAFGGITYNWTPATNISCTDCNSPYVWPDSDVTYYVNVGNQDGCFGDDSVRVMVRVRPITLLFIPNAITPNGDGYNDTWVINDLDRYPVNDVRIVNRWGDEVFQQSPYENQWGGTWKGENLPGGTYYYILRVLYNGEYVKFDGPLTIIR